MTSGAVAGHWAFRLPSSVRLARQRGSGLGKRLERAFRERQRAGAGRVVVIGSDSPMLSRHRLQQSFSSLARAPAVLGPARDGGFYLIGLALPGLKLRGLFDGVDWGGPRAFRQIRARLQAAGLRVALLPVGYDVDTSVELVRLERDLRRSRSRHLTPLRAWFRGFRTG